MISKQDVLDRAAEWQLRPDVVEKDYVLGWLIVALASVPECSRNWVFKGGTCIKKCYFETYRFSEDLDFSLTPEAAYSADEIREILRAASTHAGNLSGIEFPPHLVDVRPRRNARDQPTFLGLVSYRGPLQMPIRALPRVRFDITCHEPILDAPSRRVPLHAYPDQLPEGMRVAAYSIEELLAEKTRALFERTRPRDLYDVVFLLENHADGFDLARVREFFVQKCRSKVLDAPSTRGLIAIIENEPELRSEWGNMLAHQLPELPPLESFLSRLRSILDWIDEPTAVPTPVRLLPAPVPASAARHAAPSGLRYWGRGVPLEVLRFAGSNRLLVEFTYGGRTRLVEPYSLRQADTGNVLLYGWERGSGHIKAFNVARMSDLRATKQSFQPRYRVELSSVGGQAIPRVARRQQGGAGRTRRQRARGSRRSGGPVYVFECVTCGKRFRRTKNNSRTRKHKAPGGWDCPSRQSYLVTTS